MINLDANAEYPMSKAALKAAMEGLSMHNISSTMDRKAFTVKSYLEKESLRLCNVGETHKSVITSGASEANSSVIWNIIHSSTEVPTFAIMTSAHNSVSSFLHTLEQRNLVKVMWIQIDQHGYVKLDQFNELDLASATCLFLQSVCSESGAIQFTNELAEVYRNKNPTGIVAVDHTQGFMKVKVDFRLMDYVTISYHKIGGSVGCGALLINNDATFIPLIGGKQNSTMRGGTYNISAIKAAAAAIPVFNYAKCRELRDYFLSELSKKMEVSELNTSNFYKLANKNGIHFVHLQPKGNYANHIIFGSFYYKSTALCGTKIKHTFAANGIMVGTGSACSTGEKSHLGSIRSSDLTDKVMAIGFIRISMHQYLTKKDCNDAVRLMNKLVTDLIKSLL